MTVHTQGGYPFCPHGILDAGMLGGFHERDMGPAFPPEDRYQTSLASLRKAERRHGLEARSPNDPHLSRQEWARREMVRQQERPEMRRARDTAIREALQKHRAHR